MSYALRFVQRFDTMRLKDFSIAILIAGALVSCQSEAVPAHQEETTAAPPAEATASPLSSPSPGERLEAIQGDLVEVIAALNEDGDYNCCVQPACTWCALNEGNCTCFSNLQEGAEVCPGCGIGWHNGEGAVDGIESGDVKWNITHEHGDGGHGH